MSGKNYNFLLDYILNLESLKREYFDNQDHDVTFYYGKAMFLDPTVIFLNL